MTAPPPKRQKRSLPPPTPLTPPFPPSLVRPIKSRLVLNTLPVELQRHIYHYVFPRTRLEAVPYPRPLTQSQSTGCGFDLVGYPPCSLLQTCSEICNIAKPIRDSSINGTIDTHSTVDLARVGQWIHHTVHTIRILSTERLEEERAPFNMHAELFTKLKRVVLVRVPINHIILRMLSFMLGGGEPAEALLRDSNYKQISIYRGCCCIAKFFTGRSHMESEAYDAVAAILPALNNVEIDVYLRNGYSVSPDNEIVTGSIVRFDNYHSGGCVIAEAVRSPKDFRFWESHMVNNTMATGSNIDEFQLNTTDVEKEVPRVISTVQLANIPRRYAWIKLKDKDFDFKDLDQLWSNNLRTRKDT